MNKCKVCLHHGLYEMVSSGKPYGYSGDIPCLRCQHYRLPSDEFTPITEPPTPSVESVVEQQADNTGSHAICFSPNELHAAALAAGLNDTDIDDLIREASKRQAGA